MPLHVEVIAAERVILSEDAEVVVADTAAGRIAVLPAHAPLVTLLVPGQLRLGRGEGAQVLAISGGYLEVRENHVVVLADAAEVAGSIDVSRAVAARERAEAHLAQRQANVDIARATAALGRALARIKVAEAVGGRPAPRRVA